MTEIPTTLCCPDTIAIMFAHAHRARLRYVAGWQRWMAWDGTRWRADDTLLASDLARAQCRRFAKVARHVFPGPAAARATRLLGDPGFVARAERLARVDPRAHPFESGGRISGRLARADRALAAAPGQFDADPDLLNTQAGIVDTRSGETLPHRADAYMTRIAAVAPAAPGAPCPAWYGLLDRLTGGDEALQLFLQRAAGRALVRRGPVSTAAPARSILPAQSILIETLSRILGDDSAAASMRECLDLLPREVTRADSVRDPELNDRLVAEYPAVLRWAIDGALAWRAHGLAMPDGVRQAIDDQVAPGDFLSAWLDESVDPSANAWEPAGPLYASWALWAAASGQSPVSQKRFSQALAARGFAPRREGSGQRGFAGLRLREPALEHDEQRIGSVASVEAAAFRRPDPRPTAAATRPGCRRGATAAWPTRRRPRASRPGWTIRRSVDPPSVDPSPAARAQAGLPIRKSALTPLHLRNQTRHPLMSALAAP